MAKKVPVRQCIGCGSKKNKNELIRVVQDAEGKIILDKAQRANGRGAYLCGDAACVRLAGKKKAFSRIFDPPIPGEIYEELAQELEADIGNEE